MNGDAAGGATAIKHRSKLEREREANKTARFQFPARK